MVDQPVRRGTGGPSRRSAALLATVSILAATGCSAGAASDQTHDTTPDPRRSATTTSETQTSDGTVGEASVYTTWADDQISESSGLAFLDDTLLTVQDSGDPAVIYASAGRDGTITGTVTYAASDPVDVEAVTATPAGTVWVGDIGDNAETRAGVAFFHLDSPASWEGEQSVSATRYEATYPDGAHNAEALLVHPDTGEVLVVTKEASTQVFTAGVRRRVVNSSKFCKPRMRTSRSSEVRCITSP